MLNLGTLWKQYTLINGVICLFHRSWEGAIGMQTAFVSPDTWWARGYGTAHCHRHAVTFWGERWGVWGTSPRYLLWFPDQQRGTLPRKLSLFVFTSSFTPSFPLVSDCLNLLVFFYGGSIPVFGRQTVDVAFQFPCKFAATFHLRVDLYHVLIFVPKQMVWLPVPWSFNTHWDVMACTGMQGRYEHCKTVCAERWLGQKSLAALGSQSWVSNTLGWRSTNWAASLPELLMLTSVCSEHVLTWTIFSDVSCRAWWAQKWDWWVSPVSK